MSEPLSRFAQLVRELAAHWDEVLAALGAGDREEFLAVLESAERPPWSALLRLEDLLTSSDLDEDHPVMVALDGGSRLLATDGERDTNPGPWLMWLREEVGLGPVGEPHPSEVPFPATGLEAVLARLASIESLLEEEVSRAGVDPELAGLIRLDQGRGLRFPRFQFDRDGIPTPVVLEVNRLLDADRDPWGVTDWWIGAHAWLGLPPLELITSVGDHDRLVAAAAAEVDG